MTHTHEYETVIGLEVHVELATQTKLFCACSTKAGAEPNTHVCPVCAGLPGALPTLNGRVPELAALVGLALGCTVAEESEMARKNYFYPDLPKAYQISQFDRPLCVGGSLRVPLEDRELTVGITRIHVEEDAGKLIHDGDGRTRIDLNRCGVPLIEIVSEPDLRSAEEARAFLQTLRTVILYTGASLCRMNEGELRCDVNLSVRKKGECRLGTRTELKNLNSFAFVAKAIEAESARQIALLEAGETVIQETRRFDPATGKTYSMRRKEDATDYRYFPEPDLPPMRLSAARIAALRSSLPPLPEERAARYEKEAGIPLRDARRLAANLPLAALFEEAALHTEHKRILSNLLLSEVLPLGGEPFRCPVSPRHLAELATLCGEQTVNSSTAKAVLGRIWQKDGSPRELVEREGLGQINDPCLLREMVAAVIGQNPKSVADYRAGKTNAAKALIGQVMARSRGKANPVLVTELVRQALST